MVCKYELYLVIFDNIRCPSVKGICTNDDKTSYVIYLFKKKNPHYQCRFLPGTITLKCMMRHCQLPVTKSHTTIPLIQCQCIKTIDLKQADSVTTLLVHRLQSAKILYINIPLLRKGQSGKQQHEKFIVFIIIYSQYNVWT